jgi:hypothetical protein
MADSIKKTGTDGIHRLAWVLDELVRIPGTNRRIGLDAVLGLLPGGGDLVGGAVSAYTIVAAHRAGAGPAVILRMGLNILIDTLVGTVPLLGDLFDAGWKANTRNVALLDRYTSAPTRVRKSSLGVVILVLAGLVALLVVTAVVSLRVVRWLFAQM